MRILDSNWPFTFGAAFLFIAAMTGLHYVMTGFNQDFGFGFAMGMMTGGFIVLLAVGWRRGEMKTIEHEPTQPPYH